MPDTFAHAECFARLTQLLAEFQPLWQPLPFQHRRLAWAEAHPELADRLRALDDATCARLKADPFRASALDEWLPVAALAALVALPELPAEGPCLPSHWAEHGLSLTREQLAIAVQETVTAPRHVRRHRERANAWRLGFDALQRRIRSEDAYLPVPSLAYGRMPEDFAAFCRWAAECKGLTLPPGIDWGAFEREGHRRHAEVTRLELIRHLFRRPLEVWLVLDRLWRLEEAGFTVELGTFCARELTPRNLLCCGLGAQAVTMTVRATPAPYARLRSSRACAPRGGRTRPDLGQGRPLVALFGEVRRVGCRSCRSGGATRR
ncbi:hypothetical protein [Halomonas sp.]|uniref:hypothetical protein n=1 Tax=Halomonas sp. TaxID=1486246 RepID=UPI0035647190